jgi:SNF2 family DNA or RNA helicase
VYNLQVAAFIASVLKYNGDSGKSKSRDPFLIICPLTSMIRWQHALNFFSPPVRPIFCCGNRIDMVEIKKKWASRQASCLVTTYDVLDREREFFKTNFYWSATIVDHSYGELQLDRHNEEKRQALLPNISCKV